MWLTLLILDVLNSSSLLPSTPLRREIILSQNSVCSHTGCLLRLALFVTSVYGLFAEGGGGVWYTGKLLEGESGTGLQWQILKNAPYIFVFWQFCEQASDRGLSQIFNAGFVPWANGSLIIGRNRNWPKGNDGSINMHEQISFLKYYIDAWSEISPKVAHLIEIVTVLRLAEEGESN